MKTRAAVLFKVKSKLKIIDLDIPKLNKGQYYWNELIGFEVLNKGHFTHSDLYARTSLSDRSIDRYISYMLEINWINELPSGSEDKRVKRYVWFPKEEVYRLLLKAESVCQAKYRQFSVKSYFFG